MKIKRFLLAVLFFAWTLLAWAGFLMVFDPFTAQGSRLAALGIGIGWLIGSIVIGAYMVGTEERRPGWQFPRQPRSRR